MSSDKEDIPLNFTSYPRVVFFEAFFNIERQGSFSQFELYLWKTDGIFVKIFEQKRIVGQESPQQASEVIEIHVGGGLCCPRVLFRDITVVHNEGCLHPQWLREEISGVPKWSYNKKRYVKTFTVN